MKGYIKITVKGHLPNDWKDWFEGMELIHDEENTVMEGKAGDDAYIHGMLNRIRDLNLKLVAIHTFNELNED